MTTSRQYEMDLPVKLTPEEIAARADDLAADSILCARIAQEIEEQKLEDKQKIKALQSQLETIRGRLTDCARCIVDAEEMRSVLVEEVVLEDMTAVEVVRQDTKEVISERPVTEEDRQMDLT